MGTKGSTNGGKRLADFAVGVLILVAFVFCCTCVWANASACATETVGTGMDMGFSVPIHVTVVWHSTVRVEGFITLIFATVA